MMLRPASDIDMMTGDFRNAWEGKVSPILLWEKHPIAILGLAAGLMIALLLMRRLVMPRRRAEVPGKIGRAPKCDAP